jgi:hypothetical protein
MARLSRRALVSPPFSEVSQVDGLAMILSTEEQFTRAMEGEPAGDPGPCAVDVKLTLSEPVWLILGKTCDSRDMCLGRSLV